MKDADPVTFGGAGFERAADLRTDAAALAAYRAAPSTRILPLWRGKPAIGVDRLAPVAPGHPLIEYGDEAPIFLGRDAGGAWFALDVSSWVPPREAETLGAFFDPSLQRHPAMAGDSAFRELRAAAPHLSPAEAEIAAMAKAITGWHRSHRFCSACGAPSRVSLAGWQRCCPECEARHFPRTDPVVIMLVVTGNALLIGRSPGWPEAMYSLLAGFVEPGETIEAAVRREVFEETRVRVGAVRYVTSQPWPFPASLMLGCIGRAESTEITLDPVELDDAVWVSREDAAAIFRGAHPLIAPPRAGAIARYMIDAWLRDRLETGPCN